MGFKLGKNKGFEATAGEIKTKMSFGKKSGGEHSMPGTPVIRESLPNDILGEVDMDGTIYINKSLHPDSHDFKQTLNHEMKHATEIKLGKLAYDDNSVTYNGVNYPRKDINGVDSILVDGKWKEAGDHDFPWEKDANNGGEGIV
tara:strand:+ start:202 stop:633 length:432 start_codon:yes stop_codon:yes gene_type:complete